MQKRHPLFLSALGSGKNESWASLHAIAQYDQGGLDTTALNREDAKPPRQREPFRASRAGIEQEGRSVPVRVWLVGMAKYTDIRLFALKKGSSVLCQLPTFIQNMTDGNADARQLNHGFGWQSALFIFINVAQDGCGRSDLLQFFDHRPVTDVPGVENVIDASEVSLDGRIEQAVGVGDHSNSNGSLLLHSPATGRVPSDAYTCFQSNVNGSGDFFGKAASSAFKRSAGSALFVTNIVEIVLRLDAATSWNDHKLAQFGRAVN